MYHKCFPQTTFQNVSGTMLLFRKHFPEKFSGNGKMFPEQCKCLKKNFIFVLFCSSRLYQFSNVGFQVVFIFIWGEEPQDEAW